MANTKTQTMSLNALVNATRSFKKCKRVGRGPGSKVGKTCGRGEKGAGARAGYKRRWGYEGGQMRMFMKMPARGFNNTRFRVPVESVNLLRLESFYADGEVVNAESLKEKGLITGQTTKIKILGHGELTKRVTIEIPAISENAKIKLQEANIRFKVAPYFST